MSKEAYIEYLNIQKRLSPLQILKTNFFFFPREPDSPNLMFFALFTTTAA